MIAFDLRCSHGHVFEAWFGNSSAFEDQRGRGLISCPVCGDTSVEKAIMAPNIGRKGNQARSKSDVQHAVADAVAEQNNASNVPVNASATGPASQPKQDVASVKPGPKLDKETTEKLMTLMSDMRKKVEENCDYVGKDFAEEARKIHYGETEERGIYGETTREEAEALFEEGIDVAPLPLPLKPPVSDA